MKKPDYNRIKILIVDDQHDVLIILRNMLHELGVNQIFEASSGEDADAFMDTAFEMVNLVLCDWNMADKSGLDVLKKAKDLNPLVPFVMITGRSDIKSVMKAKDSGVDGYIRKPFSLRELERKIQHVVYREQAA